MTPAALARVPRVRRPGFSFAGLPRRWVGGRHFTHLANAANLLFPAGEQFFCRSVRQYLDRLGPELRRRAGGLIGQEARHGLEHRALFAALEEQGYELASWLEAYQRLAYVRIAPACPAVWRLATTAALEHLTAVLAVLTLGEGLLEDADPRGLELLRWHAAEEIEHRSVAFDVLQAVDPRYGLRLLGFAIAVGALHGFLLSGYRHLVRQDLARDGWAAVLREVARDLRDPGPRRCLPRAIPLALEYLRPGFHPDRAPGAELAEAYFAAWPPPGLTRA